MNGTDCGAWNEEDEGNVMACSFWMEGVLLTGTGMYLYAQVQKQTNSPHFFSLGIVGLIGNTLSIMVLSKPVMYNAFNQLLITLSTMDSIFIILAILDYAFIRYVILTV